MQQGFLSLLNLFAKSQVKSVDIIAYSMYILQFIGRLAQLARAPALQAGGHWFESSTAH